MKKLMALEDKYLVPRKKKHFDDGGEVDTETYGPKERPSGQSSPGTPGVLGAIHDAVHALKAYVIDRPRDELNAARQESEDSYISHGDPGYADGGKVDQVSKMAKFMVDKLGLDPGHASRLATQYHAPATAVSPVVRQMADNLAARPAASGVKKAPAQLAQELRAGFVHPADLNHLLYTDPTLTPLINRYQSGVDNNNVSPEQKQALIQKLQALGNQTPPQLPQSGMNPASASGPSGPPLPGAGGPQ